ncbi:MAG TPA: hypothetical protein VKW78_01125 [Terriglobales bacterium]|jgi:hypothetical protein|nr:hypothetical protein [Terriglobales bacterium]
MQEIIYNRLRTQFEAIFKVLAGTEAESELDGLLWALAKELAD